MRYLNRKFDKWLELWQANPDRKPLLVKGARQVGKTESIRHFAKKHYGNIIEINFVFQPEFKQITADGYKVDGIVKRMSALDPTLHFVPGQTLLFFDEIQEFPDIATAFKAFKADGRYDVISSGSMLGVHYKQVASLPVGSKTDYNLASLDFEEFLWACGYGADFIDDLFAHIAERRQQLAKENKKFQVSKVAKDARFRDYRGCVDWLKDAGVINVCHAMGFPELPIGGNQQEDKFKVYLADSGLLLGQLDEESQRDFRVNRNLGTYKGGLFENIVGEALVKSGAPLVYYKREDSTLEMDFFLRDAESLVPVEVKAGSAKAKSLRTLVDGERYPDIKWGIKLARGNVGFADGILTLPHWSAFLLKRLMAGDSTRLKN